MLHAEITGRFLFAADGAYLFVHLRALAVLGQLASAARPVVAWRAVELRPIVLRHFLGALGLLAHLAYMAHVTTSR